MNGFLSLADWRKRVFGPNRKLEIFIQEIDKIRSIPSKFYVYDMVMTRR